MGKRHGGKPPRWLRRSLFYYGFVVRRIFGYGTMDELGCSLNNGMFMAEERERFERDFPEANYNRLMKEAKSR